MTEDLYRQFIYKSRYSRYLPDKNRRENWDETINRYLDFISNHVKENNGVEIDKGLRSELFDAIYSHSVMPSMRALMTAGKAAERDNTCIYNCSYLPIDDPKAFDEAMHILMCGVGVGFSVERQYINQLPEIPDKIYDSDTVIVVKDSKEGWAKSLRMLIALLYSGEVPSWDLSKLRPAGTPLKTFGGRSSGPEPLNDLFKFVVRIFKNAKGRKLNSLECHDIMCKIGEVVVVGGVRRSAMISLSNLSDDRMRHAKAGAWWEANPQRSLSNNSAVYTEKPDVGIYMKEWLSIYESKSGERGIFSREAAKKVVERNGRRKSEHEFGCNPCCVSKDTIVEVLIKNSFQRIKISDLSDYVKNNPNEDVKIKAWNFETNKVEYNKISFIGITRKDAKILKITDSESGRSVKLTPDHLIWTENRGWVEAKDLKTEDIMKIDSARSNSLIIIEEICDVEDTYDVTNPTNHNFFANDILVHNSEIILRPYQFCNLSEVIVRSTDTDKDIKAKIRIATILGTLQATLTSFPYLRKVWTRNTEEERLLGVSLTGIYDCLLTSSLDETIMKNRLESFKQVAIATNKEWSEKLGINQSTAITAIKPSGTVSQLTDSASGIHPRHSKYYIRRVRADNKDPLTGFLKEVGIPFEPDIMKPDSTSVFSFPVAAPKDSVDRDHVDSISHLNLWLLYQRYWCEHKPSVTVSVSETEWPRVGAWVWDHFDEVSGVSFLPYDGGSYKQAPYESISETEYNEFLKKMPKTIDWNLLIEYSDNVEGSQTLACTAGNCDI